MLKLAKKNGPPWAVVGSDGATLHLRMQAYDQPRRRWPVLLLCLVAVIGLAACQSGAVHVGPDPLEGHGFRAVAHVNGDFDGQTFAESIPTSALVRAHGDFTVTLRAWPSPFLVIDGGADVIVEPLPGKEAEALQAVREGSILIRRQGVVGDLNPVGSRNARIARLTREYEAKQAAKQHAGQKDEPTSMPLEQPAPKSPPPAASDDAPKG